MSVVERSREFISLPWPNAVPGDVDMGSTVARPYGRADEAREKWQNLIDRKLIEWGRDPSQLDDEGVESPTPEIIQRAILLAEALRDSDDPPPDTVVPDPNGGIVFERQKNGLSEVYHVWDDGTIEWRCFQGTRLVERWSL